MVTGKLNTYIYIGKTATINRQIDLSPKPLKAKREFIKIMVQADMKSNYSFCVLVPDRDSYEKRIQVLPKL